MPSAPGLVVAEVPARPAAAAVLLRAARAGALFTGACAGLPVPGVVAAEVSLLPVLLAGEAARAGVPARAAASASALAVERSLMGFSSDRSCIGNAPGADSVRRARASLVRRPATD